jgi:hypothetical protein
MISAALVADFSALPVEDIVRELLLAHARPGLHKVYDLHAYEKEKADALKLWHAKADARAPEVRAIESLAIRDRLPTGPPSARYPFQHNPLQMIRRSFSI